MFEALSVVFIVTSIFLIITPGQDMILVMSRSMSQGWKAGIVTAMGVSVGLMGHTILAALGLGTLLHASELLFSAMKYIGAAYLIYLGIRLLISTNNSLDISHQAESPLGKLFIQGAFSNLSNPKIAIFYFSYLPQFIPQGTEHPTFQLLLLGSAFAILTFFVKGPVGYSAGLLSSWLSTRTSVIDGVNRCSGAVLIGLGLSLALEKKG